MYAVFSNKTIIYLGTDQDKAMEILELKEDATLARPKTLIGLAQSFHSHLVDIDEGMDVGVEGLSDAASKVLKKLDEAGFNSESVEDFGQRVRDNTDKAVAEVRGLGLRSLKAVGEGFVAVGDLIRQAAEDENELAEDEQLNNQEEDEEDIPF